MTLTLVDTSGIQPYIFGSNRLRENIGASYLVAAATDDWAREEAGKVAGSAVLYTGGGNAAVRFPDRPTADKFVRALSRRVLQYAPGLQLAVAHQEWDGEDGTLAGALTAALAEMARVKDERPASAPLLGLGVTRQCVSTDLPAAHRNTVAGETLFTSAATCAKLNAGDAEAETRLKRLLPAPPGFTYPRDFDRLGNSFGDQSFLAVVHADGNGLGRRLPRIAAQGAAALDRFATAVNAAATEALKTVIATLARNCENGEVSHPTLDASFRLSESGTGRNRTFDLPLRPLVFGGDDVTFLCEGRLGLALATLYLREFEKETAKRADDLGGPVSACAGVAIVKAHFPFARAYRLADELCASAKKWRRESGDPHNPDGGRSFLDWHLAVSGLSGSPQEIRQREYTARTGDRLHLRPVALTPDDYGRQPTTGDRDRRTWKDIRKKVDAFQNSPWREQRGKVKRLREVLRRGPGAVDSLTSLLDIGLEADGSESWLLTNKGWAGDQCELFDAIELADLYYPLTEEAEGGEGA